MRGLCLQTCNRTGEHGEEGHLRSEHALHQRQQLPANHLGCELREPQPAAAPLAASRALCDPGLVLARTRGRAGAAAAAGVSSSAASRKGTALPRRLNAPGRRVADCLRGRRPAPARAQGPAAGPPTWPGRTLARPRLRPRAPGGAAALRRLRPSMWVAHASRPAALRPVGWRPASARGAPHCVTPSGILHLRACQCDDVL